MPGRLAQSSALLLAALGLLSPALPALTRQCSADLNDKSVTTTFEQIYNNSRSCAVFNVIQLNRSSLSGNVNPGDNILSSTPVSDPLVSLVIPGLSGTTDFTTGTGSGKMPAPVLEPSASNLDFTINAVEVAQASTPPKPTNFWGRAGNESSVILHWDAIATATSWEFRYRRLGQSWGSWTTVADSGATTTGHTVTATPALTNGVSYQFQVRVKGDGGDGVESATVTVRPRAARGVSAEPGDRQVVLRWTAMAAATSWQVRQKAGNDNFGDWISVPSSAATTETTVSGLTNGTAYTFEVRAVNAAGEGETSAAVTATPVALPGRPVGLSASGGDESVTLTWTAGSGAFGPWQSIANSDSTTVTTTVTGLINGASYRFHVEARNGNGPGPASETATAIPEDPGVTRPVQATLLEPTGGDRQVTLNWSAIGTATGWPYQLRKGTAGTFGAWLDVTPSSSTTTNHTVTGLTNGIDYCFQVRAKNAGGPGPASGSVGVRTYGAPEKPTGLIVTNGNARVALRWDAIPGVTNWDVRYARKGQSWGNWSATGSSTSTVQVSSLTNGVTYVFQVRGKVNQTEGPVSDSAEGTPRLAAIAPVIISASVLTPTESTASRNDAKLFMTWTQSGAATSWEVQHRKSGASSWSDWTAIAATDFGSFFGGNIVDLSYGSTYSFRMRTLNGELQSSASSEKTFAIPFFPGPPSDVTTRPGNGTVVLEWTAVSGVSRTQYRQSTGTGGWSQWTTVPGGATARETLENLKVDPHRILTPPSQQGFSKGRDWGGGVFPVFP